MKAVLDTNVLVSGLLSPHGNCARLLDLFNEGTFQPVLNADILLEYEEVLSRQEFGFDPEAARKLTARFRRKGVFSLRPFPRAGLPDPSDEAFLEAARGQEAPLVTGNLKHYPPAKCHGIPVLSPRQFLDLLALQNS